MSKVFVGDVGTEIVIDCGDDISSATTKSIVVIPPSGVKKTWVASLNGSNSIKYVTQAGDIDAPGVWQLQSYIVSPDWTGYGMPTSIEVLSPM